MISAFPALRPTTSIAEPAKETEDRRYQIQRTHVLASIGPEKATERGPQEPGNWQAIADPHHPSTVTAKQNSEKVSEQVSGIGTNQVDQPDERGVDGRSCDHFLVLRG